MNPRTFLLAARRPLTFGTLLLAFAAVSPAEAQQPPDVCALYSADEIKAALGVAPTGPGRALIPGVCNWPGPGMALTVFVTDTEEPAQAIQMVESVRSTTNAPALAKEEPGLGQRAVSVIGPYGRSLDLYVASGSRLWRYNLETGDKRVDADAALPRLRAMARKAVGAAGGKP
jgi:hypothetical protein